MRRYLRLTVLYGMILAVMGATIVMAKNSMTDFGLYENKIKDHLATALINGDLPAYPDKKAYKAASPAVQAALVKDALSWAKAYTETGSFKADYEKQRAAAKPSPSPSKGNPDEQYAKILAEQRQGIENMKKNLANMPAEMRKDMQEAIKQMEENVRRTENDPQMSAMLKQGFQQNALNEEKDFQARLAAWEKDYPQDAGVLIAKQLRGFLARSKDVDFNAKLIPSSMGKMKFADPLYESKSNEWKLLFRAGKEPVQAARAFAQDWLSELEK